jgi:hypothetical protein
MEKQTLLFPSLNEMAYFIIDCGISDFVPDWKNAALTGEINSAHINAALDHYNARVAIRETVVEAEYQAHKKA